MVINSGRSLQNVLLDEKKGEMMKKLACLLILVVVVLIPFQVWAQSALVFQSDFGLKDGAVASMKGVAFGVNPDLKMYDITHEIPAFDIWAGAYQLKMTAPYWPADTVFVSVVDPGVGTERKSIVLKTKTGHYFVSPDNGTLTLIAEEMGTAEVRTIDESRYRRPGSEESYTFHGRDVYAYTGAHLASGKISFEEVGPVLEIEIISIPYQKATFDGTAVRGTIPILDVQYGNVWTNIDKETFQQLGVEKGDILAVQIKHGDEAVFEGKIPYVNTFGDVPEGDKLAYFNSLLNLSFAINWGNFAATHEVSSGPDWQVIIKKAE